MKNDNFPPFFHIVPVDKASACGLDGFGLYVVRVYAHQRDIDVFLSEADVYISLPQGGAGSDDIVGKVFFGCGEVFVFQLDTPSFFQAFVRLGGQPPPRRMEFNARSDAFCSKAWMMPLPAPSSTISIKMPHATAKPVRNVRNLLRLIVPYISCQRSIMITVSDVIKR